MQIKYDPVADALVIRFKQGGKSQETRQITQVVMADIDNHGDVSAIECLNASAYIEGLEEFSPEPKIQDS